MAFCPKCNATIGQLDVGCAACGYDFPAPADEKTGFAYSTLADLSLIVGSIAAGLGCAAAVIYGIGAAGNGDLLSACFLAPVTFCLCFAMLVVFIRIQNA